MTTDSEHSFDQDTPKDRGSTQIPLPVQILTIIFYAGFAISVSIVAMALFGIIGVVLAALFAWQWGRLPALNGRSTPPQPIEWLRPSVPEPGPKTSGNASFDAYRDALMQRLEKEQTDFEGFLTRLREAKDKSEFDRFLDDRATASREAREAGATTPA